MSVATLALAVAIGGTFSGGITALASSSSRGVIHACVNNGNGNLRAIATGRSCHAGEHATWWNQVGPAGPDQLVAFGSVANDGTKQSGTPNVSTMWDSGHHWYSITITGVTYDDASFTSLVTLEQANPTSPCVGTRAVTNGDGGNLLVVVDDGSGAPTQCGFHFAVIKA
ncbi:MAG: hypothetical protein ACYDCC_12465 [Actinomycetota bacterium]